MVNSNDKFIMSNIRNIRDNMINSRIKDMININMIIIKETPNSFLMRIELSRRKREGISNRRSNNRFRINNRRDSESKIINIRFREV